MLSRYYSVLLCLYLLLLMGMNGYSQEVAPQMVYEPFDLQQVRLLDGPLKVAQELDQKYLLSLEPDSLLYTFRTNAGLEAPGVPHGGWEAPTIEVRGQFVGHYLKSLGLMYASTGDERFKERGDLMVRELAKCQAVYGNGYLSGYPDSYLDRLESLTNLPWAPYYNYHKIMAGLLALYEYCGNGQALDVLKGMADYFDKRNEKFTHEQLNHILDHTEEGGICELWWDLYAVTKDPKHRALAEKFEKSSFLDPLAKGEDNLTGRHGNSHIPLVVAAMREYEITGKSRYLALSTFFWDRVIRARSYATGGTTDAELWGEPYQLAHKLSTTNHETCKTYNMLRLSRHLLCATGDPLYADYYERAFWNGIVGTQDPATGMFEYYVPQASGYQRVYGTPTNSFWCCYGTGTETWAKLGDSIYFHDDNSILVNLFIPSTLDWKEKGVRLEQVTSFPDKPSTALTVHVAQPTTFTLRLHIPYWSDQGVRITVNGAPLDISTAPSTFASISREWKDGDKVEMEMTMRLRTVPMPDDPNLVAFACGPVVLAGILETGLPTLYNEVANPGQAGFAGEEEAYYFLADSPNDTSFLQPVEGQPFTFVTRNQPREITFRPFYKIINERYGLYWPVIPKGSDRQKELEARAEESRTVFTPDPGRVVDMVVIADEASEKEHGMTTEKGATGTHLNHKWRHAEVSLSYTLRVLPDQPTSLRCVYWGADRDREFDVLVENQVIANVKLDGAAGTRFVPVEYPISEELTKGKEKVTVTFINKKGNAGGFFGCGTVRAVKETK